MPTLNRIILSLVLTAAANMSYAACTYQNMPSDPYTVTMQIQADNGYDTQMHNVYHQQCTDSALSNVKVIVDASNRDHLRVRHYPHTINTGMTIASSDLLEVNVTDIQSTHPISWRVEVIHKAGGAVKESKRYYCHFGTECR